MSEKEDWDEIRARESAPPMTWEEFLRRVGEFTDWRIDERGQVYRYDEDAEELITGGTLGHRPVRLCPWLAVPEAFGPFKARDGRSIEAAWVFAAADNFNPHPRGEFFPQIRQEILLACHLTERE